MADALTAADRRATEEKGTPRSRLIISGSKSENMLYVVTKY
jgi:hypothetical protein